MKIRLISWHLSLPFLVCFNWSFVLNQCIMKRLAGPLDSSQSFHPFIFQPPHILIFLNSTIVASLRDKTWIQFHRPWSWCFIIRAGKNGTAHWKILDTFLVWAAPVRCPDLTWSQPNVVIVLYPSLALY